MTTPVLLLDIDGVMRSINPAWIGGQVVTKDVWNGQDEHWSLTFEQLAVAAIRDLHESGNVEVRLCSTWVVSRTALIEALGLPDIAPALDPSDIVTKESVRAAKVAAALGVLASKRPLIWIDDKCIPADGPVRKRLDAAGALLLSPHSDRGLRQEHLGEVSLWLDMHRRVLARRRS